MSSKVDKSKKIFPSEQLSLVKPLEDASKARKKRTTLLVSLFLCVGLSMIFAAYRTVDRIISEKKSQNIGINFKLPNFKTVTSTSVNLNLDLNTVINPVLQGDNGLWSFYVETLPATSKSYSWSKNRDQLFINGNPVNASSELLKKEDTSNSFIKSALPEGTLVKENQITKDNYFEYQSIITVPGKQIFLVVKTSGASNLEKSKSLIPLLVEKIYWAVIKM